MCGICGIISKNGRVWPEESLIELMCSRMVHRGPDAEGHYVNDKMGFGMRRLKIIDLETGNQPIFNEDRSVGVVFNGEIYNFLDLKKELLTKGHHFSTSSDTEVLVHLYEEHGEEFLNKLRGMFAFAIWDEKKGKVFLARDRLGIKPLYYSEAPQHLVFASELKSILSIPFVEREIDLDALADYFTFLYVPAPRTIFRNIKKLPPAHYMIFERGKVEVKRYWSLEFFEDEVMEDERQYVERFIELLKDSVKCRLISDVPLGAFLSGGIDSSLVVAMMSELSDRPVETFSIGYKGSGAYFDERKYSRIVAKRFNTNHHEFVVEPPNVEELLDKIVPQFDEPFADASAIPNFLLSKETRKFVTVALSGLGGDELCGGYERYVGCLLAEKYRRLPSVLTKRVMPEIVRLLPDSRNGNHMIERLKRFVSSANLPFLQRYFEIVGTFNEHEKDLLLSREVQRYINAPAIEVFKKLHGELPHAIGLVNTMSFIDINTYLVDDLLTLTDRMTMANSLEARVPLIDHHLVEFFAKVPPRMKIKNYSKKYLLKKAAERFLPKEIIYKKKMGFSVPLVVWFRREMKGYVEDVLSKARMTKLGVFNYDFVSRVLGEHFAGKRNHDEKIWALINFVKWHDAYMS